MEFLSINKVIDKNELIKREFDGFIFFEFVNKN